VSNASNSDVIQLPHMLKPEFACKVEWIQYCSTLAVCRIVVRVVGSTKCSIDMWCEQLKKGIT